VVGFEPTLSFDIQQAGNLRSMVFGGEGIFLATLSGSGKIWLQSMPVKKLIRAIAPGGPNKGKESSGLLGQLLDS
jgi:uncharacterized protein (AIM24 family)